MLEHSALPFQVLIELRTETRDRRVPGPTSPRTSNLIRHAQRWKPSIQEDVKILAATHEIRNIAERTQRGNEQRKNLNGIRRQSPSIGRSAAIRRRRR